MQKSELYTNKFFKKRKAKHENEVEIGHIFFDMFVPHSCTDFGCGIGSFISALKENGVKVTGYEPFLNKENPDIFIPENVKDDIHNVDCSKVIRSIDTCELAICIEVAEHILPVYSRNLIYNLTNASSKYIIFTAAEKGQRGTGHINCRNKDDWIYFFDNYDAKINKTKTTELRNELKKLKSKMSKYLSKNIVVFKKI
jgi:hypothetical protein